MNNETKAYTAVGIAFIVILILAYGNFSKGSTIAFQENASKVMIKQDKEALEVFERITTIRKNENEISKIDERKKELLMQAQNLETSKEPLIVEIQKKASELVMYGVESKSVFLNK